MKFGKEEIQKMVLGGLLLIGLLYSYFFLLLFFWVFLKYLNNKSPGNFILLAVIVAVSTLNRESAALSVSLAATLLCSRSGLKKATIIPVAALAGTFLTVYLGMRLVAETFSTNDGKGNIIFATSYICFDI